MALITCPECAKQISDRASACPHCGFPVGEPISSDPTANLLRQMRKGLILPQIGTGGIVVARDGSSPFSSISQAISGTPAGGTIFVHKGQYVENIRIERPLTIVGVGKNTDVIVVSTCSSGIDVRAPERAEFYNLSIRTGPGSDSAISLYGCRQTVCSGCDIVGGRLGGVILDGSGASFTALGCYVTGGEHGIGINRGGRARIEKCLIAGQQQCGVILCHESCSCEIFDSVIRDNNVAVLIGAGFANIKRCDLRGNRTAAIHPPSGESCNLQDTLT